MLLNTFTRANMSRDCVSSSRFNDPHKPLHTHHDVHVNETADYYTDRFPRTYSMNVECHDDCNVVAKTTKVKEHAIRCCVWTRCVALLYLRTCG